MKDGRTTDRKIPSVLADQNNMTFIYCRKVDNPLHSLSNFLIYKHIGSLPEQDVELQQQL